MIRQTDVVLIREAVHCAPDGNSVRRTETVKVTVEWPEGFMARTASGYYEPSDWRIAGEVQP